MISFRITAKRLDTKGYDTLMFTSKQAVKSAEAIDPNWKLLPCIAIGGATKKQIEAFGGEVIHHPESFYGESLSRDIVRAFADRNILYLRPKEVSFDARSYLAKEGIALGEQIIYETSCIRYGKQSCPEPGSVIVFTSPSTIRCFLRNFSWRSDYTAVVIGNATKVHLPPEAETIVADRPLIDACIKKAHAFLMASNSK